jgi:hypothetical protein
MLGAVEMFGGVLVLGRIAAAYVTAFRAQAQVDPGIADLDALFTDVHIGVHELQVFCQVRALSSHFDFS